MLGFLTDCLVGLLPLFSCVIQVLGCTIQWVFGFVFKIQCLINLFSCRTTAVEQFCYSAHFLCTQAPLTSPPYLGNHLFAVFIVFHFLELKVIPSFWPDSFQLAWFCNSSMLLESLVYFLFLSSIPLYTWTFGLSS